MINVILGVLFLANISVLNLEYVAYWLIVQGTAKVMLACTMKRVRRTG